MEIKTGNFELSVDTNAFPDQKPIPLAIQMKKEITAKKM